MGDDVLIYDSADSLIDGGDGTDTLRIGAGSFDFVKDSAPRTQGIEIIDLTNANTGATAATIPHARLGQRAQLLEQQRTAVGSRRQRQ